MRDRTKTFLTKTSKNHLLIVPKLKVFVILSVSAGGNNTYVS